MRASLFRDRRGATMVESLILLGLVALGGVTAFRAFGGAVDGETRVAAERVATLTGGGPHATGASPPGEGCEGDRCPPGASNCFVAGTPVLTPAGLVAIEEIHQGDVVVSRDVTGDEVTLQRVARTFVRSAPELVEIRIQSADGESEVLRTTPEHPFWTLDYGFRLAGELEPREPLVDDEGRELAVVSVTPILAEATVYNFEVETTHTYFVGDHPVLVHNAPPYYGSVDRDRYHGYARDHGYRGYSSRYPGTTYDPNGHEYFGSEPMYEHNRSASLEYFERSPHQSRRLRPYVEDVGPTSGTYTQRPWERPYGRPSPMMSIPATEHPMFLDELHGNRSGVPLRRQLGSLGPPPYLYSVDPLGVTNIASERPRDSEYGRPLRHGDLTPAYAYDDPEDSNIHFGDDGDYRGPARGGGEIRPLPLRYQPTSEHDRYYGMNGDSSYSFNRHDRVNRSDEVPYRTHRLLEAQGVDMSRIYPYPGGRSSPPAGWQRPYTPVPGERELPYADFSPTPSPRRTPRPSPGLRPRPRPLRRDPY